MNAPARIEQTCPRCRGRELGTIGIGDGDYREAISACRTCGGTGTLSPVDVGPIDQPAPVHPWARENAAARIRRALIDGGARRPDVDYISRSLAAALSAKAPTSTRAQLVMVAERFVDDFSDRSVRAFVGALSETADNFRAMAWRADGAQRRSKDAEAHELEQLVDALGGTEA